MVTQENSALRLKIASIASDPVESLALAMAAWRATDAGALKVVERQLAKAELLGIGRVTLIRAGESP